MKTSLRRHIVRIMLFKLVMLVFLGYMFYGVIGKKKFSPEAVVQAFYQTHSENSAGKYNGNQSY